MIIKGRFITHKIDKRLQVEISNGTIKRIGNNLGKSDIIFNDNYLIFPGFIDLHVHARQDLSLRDIYKEDFNTAYNAALNGGVILIGDMPNNPIPPIDEKTYHQKKLAIKDFNIFLYAGIGKNTNPLNKKVPYKVFMGPSIGELYFKNHQELENSLKKYSNKFISFHCEDPILLEINKNKKFHEDKRPAFAETKAIEFAIYLTKKYNLNSKICHVSTIHGLNLIKKAKKEGLKITAEITPHHLYFDTSMTNNLLQINPPLRSPINKKALLKELKLGNIDYLATDHAPHRIEEKKKGISGIPNLDTYGLFVAWLISQGVDIKIIAKICSYNPGKFVNNFLDKKYGNLKIGYVGKFTVININKKTTIKKENLKTKCNWSPFENKTFPGEVFILQ